MHPNQYSGTRLLHLLLEGLTRITIVNFFLIFSFSSNDIYPLRRTGQEVGGSKMNLNWITCESKWDWENESISVHTVTSKPQKKKRKIRSWRERNLQIIKLINNWGQIECARKKKTSGKEKWHKYFSLRLAIIYSCLSRHTNACACVHIHAHKHTFRHLTPFTSRTSARKHKESYGEQNIIFGQILQGCQNCFCNSAAMNKKRMAPRSIYIYFCSHHLRL